MRTKRLEMKSLSGGYAFTSRNVARYNESYILIYSTYARIATAQGIALNEIYCRGIPPKSGGALTTTHDGDAGCPVAALRCRRTKASRSAPSLAALVFGVGRRTSRSTPSSSRTNNMGTTSA
mmetsp:Transcript_6220/g.22445  ORF Transcript_6220/g.22445 Transcript_6220/m.22445 type:complete len:122 (+) Transcript_6220:1775-2140(+)